MLVCCCVVILVSFFYCLFLSLMATVSVAQTSPLNQPSKAAQCLYKVQFFLGRFFPELICGLVFLLLGIGIGLAVSFGVWSIPKPNQHVTKIGAWGVWSNCSVACSFGVQKRVRILKKSYDSGKCIGDVLCAENNQTRSCFTPCCFMGRSNANLPHCYRVLDEMLTWDKARILAGRRGISMELMEPIRPDNMSGRAGYIDGNLVGIHSQMEDELVWQIAKSYYHALVPEKQSESDKFWLGMSCGKLPGDCYWSDGSSVQYSGFPQHIWSLDTQVWGQQSQLGVFLSLTNNSEKLWLFDHNFDRNPFLFKSFNVSIRSKCQTKPEFCYRVVSGDRKPWNEAAKHGKQFMVTIQSEQELNHVKTLLKDRADTEFFWIGLRYDIRLTPPWFWVDGTSMTLVNWVHGSQGQVDFPTRTCVAMNKIGEWYVLDCDKELAFIQEQLPFCDKVGFPEWSDWSDCYKNGQCKSKMGSIRFRSTKYPTVPGCPHEPTEPLYDRTCCLIQNITSTTGIPLSTNTP